MSNSPFDPILVSLEKESYSSKQQLLEYTLQMLQNIPSLDPADKAAILAYAFREADAFLTAIPQAETYKEKDQIFACADLLLGLIMQLCSTPAEIPQDALAKIQLLVETVRKERYIESALDELFQQESVELNQLEQLLRMAEETSDEYRKGMVFTGLVHYKEALSKLSDAAKEGLSHYIAGEFQRYLGLDTLSGDCIANLEMAADLGKYVISDALAAALQDVLKLGYCNVNYYAAETLLTAGADVPPEVIASLARSLPYANLTYGMLCRFGREGLFPAECSTEEYLAKSDLVHWLTYPTELGREPDAIEYLGKITYLFKKDVYHVFRFRSGSDTLDEELKGQWLIGWSGKDGGTFSNFDRYDLFEKDTIAATLKNIKKKLIG